MSGKPSPASRIQRLALLASAAFVLLRPATEARPPQDPQAPPSLPSFPARVELVTVDVVVTDGEGRPVSGLTREEFALQEDGRAQVVEGFEAVKVPAAAAEPAGPRPRVSSNETARPESGRSFVLVFDDVNLTPFLGERAKAALAEFLRSGVRAADRVLLVSTGGGAWWSAQLPEGREELLAILERLEGRSHPDTAPDRITPWEAMRIHLYRDLQVGARVYRRWETYGALLPSGPGTGSLRDEYRFNFEHPLLLGRAQQVYQQTVARQRLSLGALERALQALGPRRGREAVVLVSEGFIHDPNLDEFKRVLETARRVNAALYFVDARGLEGMPLAASAEIGRALEPRDFGTAFVEGVEASEGAELLASESGGFSVKNTNDLGRGFERLSAESEAYYLLGYRSDNAARDGRFRKIRVEVRRKGVRVRARTGYYAPLEGRASAFERKADSGDPELESALNSPFDVAGLPLRASGFVFQETLLGKAKVVLAAEVDVRSLALQAVEGRLLGELDNLIVVSHRETGEFFRHDQKLELKLLPGAVDQLGRNWYAIARDFELAPGGYQARIVVREKGSGRIGAVTHAFEVPPLGGLRVSTPVLGDTLHRTEGGGAHPVMVLRRRFPAGGVLYCEYEVYGAERDKASGMPRVAAGFEVRRPDGETAMRVDATQMRPTSLGRLSRIVVAPLRGLAAGDYELILRLTDEVAGKTLEAREAFGVEASEPTL